MNRTVPTLLGVVIILLAALLVVGIFNLRLYGQLAGNGQVVGTQLHERLTGESAATELDEPSAVSSDVGIQLPLDPNRPRASKLRQNQEASADRAEPEVPAQPN